MKLEVRKFDVRSMYRGEMCEVRNNALPTSHFDTHLSLRTLALRFSPACLCYARDISPGSKLPEAYPAQFKPAHIASAPAAQLASIVSSYLKFRFSSLFYYECFFGHISFSAPFLFLKRHAEEFQ